MTTPSPMESVHLLGNVNCVYDMLYCKKKHVLSTHTTHTCTHTTHTHTLSLSTEKDTSNELLWVWSFPAIIPGLRALITSRCTITSGGKEGEGEAEETGLPFSFGHVATTWYYLANFSTGEAGTLPRVRDLLYTLYILTLYKTQRN